MTNIANPAVTDEMSVSLRAYAGPTWRKLPDLYAPKKKAGFNSPLPPSNWSLTFDTETTTDAGQALRFGTYQLRKVDEIREGGIFYDEEGVSKTELTVLRGYAKAHCLKLITRDEFVNEVFYRKAYQLRATIVGFNLPFDISRIAISHGSARAPKADIANAMRGGFTFKLSKQKIYPNIRVKHMSRKAALISFAAPMKQRDGRGHRNRGIKNRVRRGHFIDAKTLSSALFSKGFSLRSLSKFLGVNTPKMDFEDYDAPINEEFIRYAVADVQSTWECYSELITRYGKLDLSQSTPEKIYSEAGIGKAYIREMGIAPWRTLQPDMPPALLAKIMGSYFGGRSEVRIRREVRQVILCDFLSMYPTVCTLMGLWEFVIADGMSWQDSTEKTRKFLNKTNLEDLQDQSTWAQLATLVRVVPDADIFPVRAAYSSEAQSTIGTNYLTSKTPLWFTLADCIASKLLSGKTPRIIEAISFKAGPVQSGLKPINIAGNPAYRVDPNITDFFKRTIEMRQSIKRRMKGASEEERARLDTEQNSLKICANSTSYGIWVEVNVETRPIRKSVTVHSSTSGPFSFLTDKSEMPGKYFHPLLATLITGAARLMLASAERLAIDQGLEWSFCDTDSMAFAKPDHMEREEFEARVKSVVEWFVPLNPYEFGGSILKIEDVNYSLENGKPEPLYCFAISSKRYALFNLEPESNPVMRKVSAHGLGHLLAPYGDADAPTNFPTPHQSVLRDGTARWHCDLWHQIVSAALAGKPDQVGREYHPSLNQPAISRYAATSPDLLRWFKKYNQDRPYRDQVKPFGFLLSLSAAWNHVCESLALPSKKGRHKKPSLIKPIAPFDTDHQKAVAATFDRETGARVLPSSLRTYSDALAQYHISPESKFLNGDFLDSGTTQRRHMLVSSIIHIGKEAHDWERQAILGLSQECMIGYGVDRTGLAKRLKAFAQEYGITTVAKYLQISVKQIVSLSALEDGAQNVPLAAKTASRLPSAMKLCAKAQNDKYQNQGEIRKAVLKYGLRVTARKHGVDASNLRRKLRSG